MRILWRAALVLVLAGSAGYATMHLLVVRAVSHGQAEYNVRLAGAMAGLFVGGVTALLTLLFLLLGRRREPSEGIEPQ